MLNEFHPPEHAGVRHILTSPRLAARCTPYIGDHDFDWSSLLAEAETMSGGERLLVRIAHDLWEANGDVGLWELPRRLDRANFERVLDALEVCRGDLPARRLEVLVDAA
jgi:hypothetical protein